MKFLVPIYSCLQNPWLGGYRPQIPVLSILCPQLNLLNTPPPEQNSWVRHWYYLICGYDRFFHINPNILFINYPKIWHYNIWTIGGIFKKARFNKLKNSQTSSPSLHIIFVFSFTSTIRVAFLFFNLLCCSEPQIRIKGCLHLGKDTGILNIQEASKNAWTNFRCDIFIH